MFGKTVVFGGDDRHRQLGRYLIKRNPRVSTWVYLLTQAAVHFG